MDASIFPKLLGQWQRAEAKFGREFWYLVGYKPSEYDADREYLERVAEYIGLVPIRGCAADDPDGIWRIVAPRRAHPHGRSLAKPIRKFKQLAALAGASLPAHARALSPWKLADPISWWLTVLFELSPPDSEALSHAREGKPFRIFWCMPFYDSLLVMESLLARPQEYTPEQTLQPHSSRSVNPKSFVFARDGDGYVIEAFGVRARVRALKGFAQIEQLIRTPGRPVPMTQLFGGGDDKRAGREQRSRQEAFDTQARDKINDRLKELRQEYDAAKKANSTVQMDVAAQEIHGLELYLRHSTGRRGRSRDLNSLADKLRPSILGALKRAYQALRDTRPSLDSLASHLELSIQSEGSDFVYPAPAGFTPAWSFELPRQ